MLTYIFFQILQQEPVLYTPFQSSFRAISSKTIRRGVFDAEFRISYIILSGGARDGSLDHLPHLFKKLEISALGHKMSPKQSCFPEKKNAKSPKGTVSSISQHLAHHLFNLLNAHLREESETIFSGKLNDSSCKLVF